MLAKSRAQRWHDLTMIAQRFNAGPNSSSYLKTSERFDRPIIRTFQRHPGNQLPEAQMTAKVCKKFRKQTLISFFFISLGYNKSSTIS
jgi:hypothetical protein